MPRLKPHEIIHLYSMGKRFPLTAIFDSDEETKAHYKRHPDDVLVACAAGKYFVASQYNADRINAIERAAPTMLEAHRAIIDALKDHPQALQVGSKVNDALTKARQAELAAAPS